LSACTQAVMAAEVGHLGLAFDYLGEAALMDLHDLEHNTRDGLHIASLAGDTVRFTDGSEVEADAVVYCTGYNLRFPFLSGDVIDPVDNRVDLFHQVFAPNIPNLAFIGLVQPFGALMPVAEAQSRWVADHLAGTYRLPPSGEMLSEIHRARVARERQFVASPRHTMEIDFYAYLRGLRRERRRGAGRAAQHSARPLSR